ncbi:MAG TPA: sulfatase-like hydrolase/transferase [Vicinamibacterales bacterium]|jgi:arylsulfatase A-like enzyme
MKKGVLIVLAAAIVAAAGWAAWRTIAKPAAPGPIVLISIDTLRADHLPIYGYTKVRTPNIDALASGGVVFERAYSQVPQTLPAHTSILSGELPFEDGVRDNVGFTVKPGQWLIQRALHDRGWPTGGFVSAYVLRKATGIGQGFDVYDSEMPPTSGEEGIGQVQRDGAETLASALKWVDARDLRKPFFLFIHFYEPHMPYTPPARYSMYLPYDGEIAYADELVGRLLDHLRDLKLYDRSTIVLLSDHGEGLGDHGELEHGLFLYQETVHVPLVVKLPDAHAATRVATPVQHIDVVPTLLEEAGLPKPSFLHGRSLMPLLRGTGTIPDAAIYAESLYSRYHFGWSELYALTDSRYHFIRAPRDELYDLQHDPHEATSIVAERPQVHQAMRTALEEMLAHTLITAPAAVDAQDRERLAALGYVGTGSDASLSLPGDSLPDPKDKIPVLEKYRRASNLAGQYKFAEATALYKEILAGDPNMTDVWLQLAEVYVRQGMSAEAVDAYREVIKRNPKDAGSLLSAGSALLKLGKYDEAKQYGELAVSVMPGAAHELLANIALAQHDRDEAMQEATLAQQADATLPMPLFIQGLIAYHEQRYGDALGPFMQAHDVEKGRSVQINDLDYDIGDSLAHLERYTEAEPYFLEEIKVFPHNLQARAGLAMLYRAMGRNADSEREIDDLLKIAPTAEGRALAAKLWTMFGEPEKARRGTI